MSTHTYRSMRRRYAEGLEDEGGGLAGPLEPRQVTGPAQLDQGRCRDAGGDRAGGGLEPVDVELAQHDGRRNRDAAEVDLVVDHGRRVGHSSAAIWTSNARRCIRVSSERASSSASGPSHVSTLRATAPSTSPASMRRSSSSSKASDAAVGATPRRPGQSSTSAVTRSGWAVATSSATRPPKDGPDERGGGDALVVEESTTSATFESGRGRGASPYPGRSGARTRYRSARTGSSPPTSGGRRRRRGGGRPADRSRQRRTVGARTHARRADTRAATPFRRDAAGRTGSSERRTACRGMLNGVSRRAAGYCRFDGRRPAGLAAQMSRKTSMVAPSALRRSARSS